jgi:hypothetical protein
MERYPHLVRGRSALSGRNGIVLGVVAVSAVALFAMPPLGGQAMVAAAASVPTAACAQMIYSGSSPKGVFHTPHDIVVGPARFGDLDPRLFGKSYGSSLLGIKSPMTIGPTKYSALVVTAKGARSPVSIVYGQAPSTTTTTVILQTESGQIVAQAPVSCGLPGTGFVQYGGGFLSAGKQCVTLTVSTPGGRTLARGTVPFGWVACVPNVWPPRH